MVRNRTSRLYDRRVLQCGASDNVRTAHHLGPSGHGGRSAYIGHHRQSRPRHPSHHKAVVVMTNDTKMDTKYGKDDIGQVWRAHPKPDQPSLIVLEVLYTDADGKYDLWDICNNDDMSYITNKMGITWSNQVIEV